MAQIFIDRIFESYVEQRVVPAFAAQQIGVTDAAQALFAIALQAQLQDRLVRTQQTLLARADLFLQSAVGAFLTMYPTGDLNFNRAVHLLVELNQRQRNFPWQSVV